MEKMSTPVNPVDAFGSFPEITPKNWSKAYPDVARPTSALIKEKMSYGHKEILPATISYATRLPNLLNQRV